MHVVLRAGKSRPMCSWGLPASQNPGPLLEEKKTKKKRIYKKTKRGEARSSAGAEGADPVAAATPLNREQLLPDSRRALDYSDEIEA